MSCVKYLLFLFNSVFAVTGLLLLLTGLVVQSVYSQYLDFLSHRLLSPPVLLTIIGGVIATVSFFGCCGAIMESHGLTRVFCLLLTTIFFLEMVTILVVYQMRGQVRRETEQEEEEVEKVKMSTSRCS